MKYNDEMLFIINMKTSLISDLYNCVFLAEIGDFDEVQCKQHLLNNKYIPDQDVLMDRIMEYHQKHV